MPRILKTVLPRIKKSVQERGFLVSLARSFLLPMHLLQEYRAAKRRTHTLPRSDFDAENGVDTDGEINGWTYLSDLDIPSENWIYGRNYAPIEPPRFRAILASIDISFLDFTFIDFGSGKGRALLLASERPFKRIVGVEFSPELHRIAQRNLEAFKGPRKCAAAESVCMDFLLFELPNDPLVLFFFDPCEDRVLLQLLARVRQSIESHPRSAYLIYVAPTTSKKGTLDASDWLVRFEEDRDLNFCVYHTRRP